jgi:uncharacterized protein (TIGR03067 family)
MRSFKLLTLLVVFTTAAVGCSKKTEPETPSGGGSSTDRDKLQGLWALESIEDGRPDTPRRQEEIKNSRVKIEGDKLTIFAEGDEMKFTFTVDEAQNPKVIALTEVVEGGRSRRSSPTYSGTRKAAPEPAREPEKSNWIYKFEGDKVVVAFFKGDDKGQPTEFKARAGKFEPGKNEPGIIVITLKKTDSPPPPVEPRKFTTSRAGTRK